MIIITIILIIKVVLIFLWRGKKRKERGCLRTITTELKTDCI